MSVDNEQKPVIKNDGDITPLLLPTPLGVNHGGVTGSPTTAEASERPCAQTKAKTRAEEKTEEEKPQLSHALQEEPLGGRHLSHHHFNQTVP